MSDFETHNNPTLIPQTVTERARIMSSEEHSLQAAIYESLRTSSSSSSRPSSTATTRRASTPNAISSASGRRQNTLSREGISPANVGVFAGSTFGKPGNRKHSSNDQQKSHEVASDLRKFPSRRPSHIRDQGSPSSIFLPRSQWISLGDGWFQTTPIGTGQCNRCGLHSIIESSLGQLFVTVYEPRSSIGVASCLSECPNYDLEISLKTIKAKNSPSLQCFEVLIGFQSATEYVTLGLNSELGQWTLSHVTGNETHVIGVVAASDIRPNIFYSLLIQVRDTLISIDVEGVPIFTSLRIPSPVSMAGTSLSGLMGLLAKGSKFAVKGWKLRARATEAGSSNGRRGSSSQGEAPQAKKTMSLRESLAFKSRAAPERLGEPLPTAWGEDGLPPQRNSSRRHSSAIAPPSSSSEYISQSGPGRDLSADKGGGSTPEARMMRCASILRERHDRSAVDLVMSDIVQRDMGVKFDDIAALSTAKRLLNEAVVLPLMMPELFTGIREPWKGVLLFGPPGTGKTMLAKAVADTNHATFFSCSAASLISKFRGESEKIVKCLFEAARLCSPSIIFLDEVDALVSSRGADGEHEASRRLKTEFFSQMDGVASSGQQHGVMVLATTNCPWDLDEAIRRRLEKRIYIPLPDDAARVELFSIYLRSLSVASDVTPVFLARATEGYSGFDIHLVCREAAMMPMRLLLQSFSPQQLNLMKQQGSLLIAPVSMQDFFAAIHNTKPSVSADSIARYLLWDEEFGSR